LACPVLGEQVFTSQSAGSQFLGGHLAGSHSLGAQFVGSQLLAFSFPDFAVSAGLARSGKAWVETITADDFSVAADDNFCILAQWLGVVLAC
jgi:hypothetical protein